MAGCKPEISPVDLSKTTPNKEDLMREIENERRNAKTSFHCCRTCN